MPFFTWTEYQLGSESADVFTFYTPRAPRRCARRFLAEDYFRRRGIRDRVEITYVTPLGGAFAGRWPAASSAACWPPRASNW